MTSAVDSHLRDLESEARDAETEVEAYRDRSQTRIEDMNNQIRELVAKTQMEKATIKETIERKQQYAKKKQEEVVAFRVRYLSPPISNSQVNFY
jgi:DNA replication protein DnaD